MWIHVDVDVDVSCGHMWMWTLSDFLDKLDFVRKCWTLLDKFALSRCGYVPVFRMSRYRISQYLAYNLDVKRGVRKCRRVVLRI